MTKSAENDPEVKRLVRRVEKLTGDKFPLPPQWSAKRAKTKLNGLLTILDPDSCLVCGRKH